MDCLTFMQKLSNVYKAYLVILYFLSLVLDKASMKSMGGKGSICLTFFKTTGKVTSTLKFLKNFKVLFNF